MLVLVVSGTLDQLLVFPILMVQWKMGSWKMSDLPLSYWKKSSWVISISKYVQSNFE